MLLGKLIFLRSFRKLEIPNTNLNTLMDVVQKARLAGKVTG